ncbi:MAG TPA: DinB family protein [Phototrophicaceae bacterium]|nr:DinB family protein [Phototrophicaceae bacterium]
MDSGLHQDFRYLDTDEDRQQLVSDIRHVRQQVIQMAESIPPEQQYEPRYHGWSLAAMLAHLDTIDGLALTGIKLALIGLRPPISLAMLNGFNDMTARIYQRRVVTTTIKGIQRTEKRIDDLIMTLPMDRFTREVYHPPSASYLTVERALQQYFLFHWHEHLQTMQRERGIYYEPPQSSAEM